MNLSKSLSMGVIAMAGMAYACGGGSDTKKEAETSTAAPAEKEISLEEKYKDDPDYVKGLALVKESDCPSCHMVERKIVGPSYADVAAKYESTEENIEMLASRVIAGNVGEWGEVPMPAHPGLTEEDAQQMVKYILLLKK